MIFFKFNLISFTVTILAVSIIPAYSQNNCKSDCSYILINHAGYENDLVKDQGHCFYKCVKREAMNRIHTLCVSLGIIERNDIGSVIPAIIIINLVVGYNGSIFGRLTNSTTPVTTYCGVVCGNDDATSRNNFTIIRSEPLIYS